MKKAFVVGIVLTLGLGTATLASAATNSIKCSNGTVTVSTGGGTGACVKVSAGQKLTCQIGSTEVASGGCDANGKASCGDTLATGTCTIAQGVVRPPKLKLPMPAISGTTTKKQ